MPEMATMPTPSSVEIARRWLARNMSVGTTSADRNVSRLVVSFRNV